MVKLPPCRLFMIMAREAPRAVIFRRGPSKFVELILWHTDTDEFIRGQWFKGRIYERSADLSPDGSKLIYFAAQITPETWAAGEDRWTAISKPPYLTALAFWMEGGGGLFEDNRTVVLPFDPDPAKAHFQRVPKGLTVHFRKWERNEDIYASGDKARFDRAGWIVRQAGILKGWFKGTERPEIRERWNPSGHYAILLTRWMETYHYYESFQVVNRAGEPVVDTQGVSCADWDQRGRLVLLKEGRVWIGAEDIVGQSLRMRELANFNEDRFEPVVAPDWAKVW